MKKLSFIIVLLNFSWTSIYAQNTEKIQLDLSSSFFINSFYKATEYFSINHLVFKESPENSIQASELRNFYANTINKIEFQNISDEDFIKILRTLPNTKRISSLIIRDCKITNLPLEFIINANVKELIVENCRTLSPASINRVFSVKSPLLKIGLVNCGLYNLEYIHPDSKLMVVDLRNNKISSAGSQLSKIQTIDSIFLTGNHIPNSDEDLLNFKNSKIKYIETDSISISTHNKLRKMNEDIKWKFVGNSIQNKIPVNNIFGQFKINNSDYRVYSPAYLQYNRIFNNTLLTFNYDTIKNEERFWDTTSINSAYRQRLRITGNFKLYKTKTFLRRHITFQFYKDNLFSSTRSAFMRLHPEVLTYKKYYWVTEKAMTSREFKNHAKTTYVDLRLKYNSEGKYYTLYLKKDNGKIDELRVFPVKGKPKAKNEIDIDSKDYTTDYAKYLYVLAKINRKDNKIIDKNKRKIRVSIAQMRRNSWNELREFMSPEEREMSEEEWLNYYWDILKYEEQALDYSYPEFIFLARKFAKIGLTQTYQNTDTIGLKQIYVYFTDDNDNNIPVQTIYIIDKSELTYRILNYNATIDPIIINLNENRNYSFIIFLPDNSVGMVKPDQIASAFNDSKRTKLKSQVVESSLITIGQILYTFELK